MSKKHRQQYPSFHPPQVPNPATGKSIASVSVQRITIQGPLPAPPVLRQYEEIYPGFTNRLLTIVEEEGKHRRSMDQPTLDANYKLARAGQIVAGVVCMTALVSGTVLVYVGNTPVGVAVMFGAIASVVGPFLALRRPKAPQNEGGAPAQG
jgi:uncharacterized membrane protein